MDVYCPRCGEPYDVFSLTDEFTDEERKRFWAGKGCPCCVNKEVREKPFRAEATAALREVLGEDVDGLAAALEDFGL